MVKKMVEMEVDFPDCAGCGKGILEGDDYFSIDIGLSKGKVDHRGSSCGCRAGNSGNPLTLCENCFSDSGMDTVVKLKIIMELERQRRILENIRGKS